MNSLLNLSTSLRLSYIILRKFGLFKTWLVSVLGALYGFGVTFFLSKFEIKTDSNAEFMVHFAICGFVVAFVASVIVNREYKSNKILPNQK